MLLFIILDLYKLTQRVHTHTHTHIYIYIYIYIYYILVHIALAEPAMMLIYIYIYIYIYLIIETIKFTIMVIKSNKNYDITITKKQIDVNSVLKFRH